MPGRCSAIVLSRFFDKNVKLIAGMCERCYEECDDVKIIAVNFVFLKRMGKFGDLSKAIELNEKVEHGFSRNEMKSSVKRNSVFNEIVKRSIDEINNIEERFLIAKSERHEEGVCRGFTPTDMEASTDDVKNVVNACNRIRCKLYKKVSTRALRNISKTRTIRNSTHKNPSKISKRRLRNKDSESKYFSISFDNNNTKIAVKEEYPDVGKVKLENQCQLCKANSDRCSGFCSSTMDQKFESIDYESLYFRSLQGQGIPFKPEGSIKIESGAKVESEDGVVRHKPPIIFTPPKSPHNLIEEHLYHDPWALLVATIFLNRTSCMCARPHVFWFLSDNPDPFSVLGKYPQDLEKYFVRLGLQKTRAVQVWRMSHDFIYKKWSSVKDLYGIGVYGDDAFRMFCLGDFTVEPKDRFLKIYKAWYQKVAQKGGP